MPTIHLPTALERLRRDRLGLLLVLAGVVAAVSVVLATGPVTAALPESGLPTYELTIAPNWVAPEDGMASNYNAVWAKGGSPTTPWTAPDSCACRQRYILTDPRRTDSAGIPGQDEQWFVTDRYWPSSYPAGNHGAWGRIWNMHTVANDDGGIGWSWGDGVSSVALDFYHATPELNLEYNGPNGRKTWALPDPARDTWHTYVANIVWGRTDGSTVRPGRVRIWMDGRDTPVVDTGAANTLMRAIGPDGRWHLQRWVQLWEGDYTRDIQLRATQRLTLTRVGATLAQSLADTPRLAGENGWRSAAYRGTGINLGGPSLAAITPRTAGQSLVPASLTGGAASPTGTTGTVGTTAGSPTTTTTTTTPTPVVTTPVGTAPPVVSGAATQGSTLSSTTGTWTGSPTGYAYQWRRCGTTCTDLPGATAATYVAQAADVGAALRVRVTARNAAGTGAAIESAATTPVTAPVPTTPTAPAPPTSFGATAPGTRTVSPGAGYTFGTPYTLTTTATTTHFQFHARGGTRPQTFTPAIYATNGTTPTTLIATGTPVTVPPNLPAGWLTTTLPTTTLTPGTYTLTLLSAGTPNAATISYDPGTTTDGAYTTNTTGTPTPTFGTPKNEPRRYSYRVLLLATPVTAPTPPTSFGATAPGTRTVSPGAGYTFGTPYTLTTTATTTHFQFHARGGTRPQTFTPAIYATNGTTPTTLIATGTPVTVPPNLPAGWLTTTLPTTTLTPGTYTLTLLSAGTPNAATISYDPGTTTDGAYTTNTTGTPTPTFGTPKNEPRRYSYRVLLLATPVTAPTPPTSFGATAPGTRTVSPGAGYTFGTPYTLTTTATTTHFQFHARGGTRPQTFTPAIYATNGTTPTTLIATGTPVTVPPNLPAGWLTTTLPTTTLTPGTYTLTLLSAGTPNAATISYDPGTTTDGAYTTNTTGTPTPTFGTPKNEPRRYSYRVLVR